MGTEETIAKVAKELGETEETPLAQLAGVTSVLGEERVLSLLKKTQEVEEQGGMLVPDGSRRRTPGGVFFYLARQELSAADRKRIFTPAKKPSTKPPESTSPRPRPRVIDVAAERAKTTGRASKFKPPELDAAVVKARARKQIKQAISPLHPQEQYQLLLDILAGLHDKLHPKD